ncbi:hypothetical protein DFH07DRAFT_769462 [Mycena maculata]|uniref:Uncharacterized protein n=1 Tax=Mycena maculata TaxID=230809 RepID=A0AAD7JRF3_9AGAR|nr:hypothetical protein DFH07DRAFT_769462 [Mycena maculata]
MFYHPELAEIFEVAFPLVAKILVIFDDRHPVSRSFTKYFSGKKSVDQHRTASDWMCTLNLVPTPELEAALSKPLISLLGPLNLNGDIVEDLITGCVVRYPSDGPAALAAMFAAIPLTSVQSGVLTQRMLKFNADHATYDRDYRPPTYRWDDPSIFKPTVVIPVVLKQEGSEEVEVYGGYEKEPGHGNKAEAKKEEGGREKEASGSGGELMPTLALWNSAVVSTKGQHVDLHVSSSI